MVDMSHPRFPHITRRTADAPALERPAGSLFRVLDDAHRALRAVDCEPTDAPLSDSTLDAVADAFRALETFARENGIPLSEFRR
jgi:hypothetical protein